MRTCPKCRSSDYNNRQFQLMINVCGHSLCRNCVDTIFALNSGPCPVCARTLKKNGFWAQLLDDPVMERQVHYRKEYAKVFNLTEDNFPSLREYNDYLEFVEEVMEALSTDTGVEATLGKVAEFEARWEAAIAENRGKRSADEAWVERELEEERRYRERVQGYRAAAVAEAGAAADKSRSARQAAASVIAQLQTSAEPAAFIVNNAQRAAREAAKRQADQPPPQPPPSKQPRLAAAEDEAWDEARALAAPAGYEFRYAPPPILLNGPAVYSGEELGRLGFLAHIRQASKAQLAGGYSAELGCFRALLDASSDLFLF